MKRYSDNDIIHLVRLGESNEVLSYLYKTLRPKIKNWILNNSGSEEEAQDIFQDAIIAFYKYVQQNKFEENKSIESFLFVVSKNLWINRVKQKNKLVNNLEHIPDTFEEDYLDGQISEERTKKIQDILSQLGERCKDILTYSVFYKMSMQEISEKMDFSNADTAKTKNYKCKQRLIKLVKESKAVKEFFMYD